MKVLANDGISNAGKNKLEENGFTVITDKVEQDALADFINKEDVQVLLVRSATKVRQPLIDACPGLKLIGRGGVGLDNIDVAHAREKGIPVINTPAASSQSVAELVMGMMFSIARGLHDSYRNMPENGTAEFKTLKKKYAKGIELRGKTLGIVGFGRIGRSLASYALGCGMKVVAADHQDNPVDIPLHIEGVGDITASVTPTKDLKSILGQCDVLSLHVPKQADGSAVLQSEELSMLKDGAMLINAARGGVIDEAALKVALDKGKVAYAALDVFDNEPTPDAELLANDRIACTPHIGAATLEAQDRIGIELADQIIEFSKVTA